MYAYRLRTLFSVLLALAAVAYAVAACAEPDAKTGKKERVVVAKNLIHYDDGDTIEIHWPKGSETIRVLGIDTPEVMHLEHNLPFAQPFGYEAAGFLRGAIAATQKVELLRSGQKDRYGRTLGYLLLDGVNYSVLVIRARLAEGPNPRYGDNGLPEEYAACQAAAATAGPVPFEAPWLYRKRMRAVTKWMKAHGTYPKVP